MSQCTGCGRPGVPYEYRGQVFDGLCAYRGDRLCPACRDARMAETGVTILVVPGLPPVPPHTVSSVRDRDVVFPGFPAARRPGWTRCGPHHARLPGHGRAVVVHLGNRPRARPVVP